MLNNNFAKIAQLAFFGGYSGNARINDLYNQKGELNTTAGSYGLDRAGIITLLGKATTKVHTSKLSYDGTYLAFGEGGIPNNEYTLAKEIEYGILECSHVAKANTANGGIQYISTITNISDKEVVVGEIGLFMDFSYTSQYYGQSMIGRIDNTESDELPVTLKAGETRIFSFGLNFKN